MIKIIEKEIGIAKNLIKGCEDSIKYFNKKGEFDKSDQFRRDMIHFKNFLTILEGIDQDIHDKAMDEIKKESADYGVSNFTSGMRHLLGLLER